MPHELIKMSISYLKCIQSYLRSWSQNFKWVPTLSQICVDHSSHQAVVPGPLALPFAIWNFYSMVIPITNKFQVLIVTFWKSIYHLQRCPMIHLRTVMATKEKLLEEYTVAV